MQSISANKKAYLIAGNFENFSISNSPKWQENSGEGPFNAFEQTHTRSFPTLPVSAKFYRSFALRFIAHARNRSTRIINALSESGDDSYIKRYCPSTTNKFDLGGGIHLAPRTFSLFKEHVPYSNF